jgi:phosphatidylinositol dimannoside acyltransferase
MRGLLLRAGLHAADFVARLLPSRIAYPLADIGGRAWYRLAGPGRRALVAENLRRVRAAQGQPAEGRELAALVERAFVEHARYWMEVFRIRHYPEKRFASMLHAEGWETLAPIISGGAVIAVPHLGNFEPFAHFLEWEGISGLSPVEETEPKELYDFLVERRLVGGRGIQLVPLSQSVRPMLAALRDGRVVALAADRDLAGDGVPVTLFGRATTLPAGAATLALRTGRPLLVARALRLGPDRFTATAWPVSVELSGDRRADTLALTRAMAAGFERAIAEAPEQWFGAFQPIWLDQRVPR